MKHPSDQELLLAADGELDRGHLDSCEVCRARVQVLDRALADYQIAQRQTRAAPPQPSGYYWFGGAVAALLALTIWMQASPFAQGGPDPKLTPGAFASSVSCVADVQPPAISLAMATEVFGSYGIAKPIPGEFEVDYLIPPDLGGTADPRNLWPQPYSRGVWNSRVKDALEDRLKVLVCAGKMGLADAQRDLQNGWVEAYKRHFKTQQPLYEHAGFIKDRAWE